MRVLVSARELMFALAVDDKMMAIATTTATATATATGITIR
jgi:hypothetical protein